MANRQRFSTFSSDAGESCRVLLCHCGFARVMAVCVSVSLGIPSKALQAAAGKKRGKDGKEAAKAATGAKKMKSDLAQRSMGSPPIFAFEPRAGRSSDTDSSKGQHHQGVRVEPWAGSVEGWTSGPGGGGGGLFLCQIFHLCLVFTVWQEVVSGQQVCKSALLSGLPRKIGSSWLQMARGTSQRSAGLRTGRRRYAGCLVG